MRYRVAHRRAAAQSGLTQVLGAVENLSLGACLEANHSDLFSICTRGML
jgi:hypothetical protein